MTWLENFYLSENITDNRKKIKRRINWTNDILEYYLLAVSNSARDFKDVNIIPALEFKTLPNKKKNDFLIVGVSNGYYNAQKLVSEISEIACGDLEILEA